jgi:hypothetical protein
MSGPTQRVTQTSPRTRPSPPVASTQRHLQLANPPQSNTLQPAPDQRATLDRVNNWLWIGLIAFVALSALALWASVFWIYGEAQRKNEISWPQFMLATLSLTVALFLAWMTRRVSKRQSALLDRIDTIARDIEGRQQALAELEVREKIGAIYGNLEPVRGVNKRVEADPTNKENPSDGEMRNLRFVYYDCLAALPVVRLVRRKIQDRYIEVVDDALDTFKQSPIPQLRELFKELRTNLRNESDILDESEREEDQRLAADLSRLVEKHK